MRCDIPQVTYTQPADFHCTRCKLLGHIVSDDGLTVTIFFSCECPTIPAPPDASLPIRGYPEA